MLENASEESFGSEYVCEWVCGIMGSWCAYAPKNLQNFSTKLEYCSKFGWKFWFEKIDPNLGQLPKFGEILAAQNTFFRIYQEQLPDMRI